MSSFLGCMTPGVERSRGEHQCLLTTAIGAPLLGRSSQPHLSHHTEHVPGFPTDTLLRPIFQCVRSRGGKGRSTLLPTGSRSLHDRRRELLKPPLALGRNPSRPMPFSTADISIQLLMDTTNTLQ